MSKHNDRYDNDNDDGDGGNSKDDNYDIMMAMAILWRIMRSQILIQQVLVPADLAGGAVPPADSGQDGMRQEH